MQYTLYKKLWNSDIVRFLMVGVANTIVGYCMNLILYNLVFWGLKGMDYWLSTFISNGCGAALSYFLNRKFTFRSNAKNIRSIPLFIAVILICYFIAYFLAEHLFMLAFTAAGLQLSQRLEGNIIILCGMCIYTVLNYFGQKLIVFR